MSLYQKYRPRDFQDLVGQSFIKKALTSALTQDKTVGAYLFCGSRWTGKTSVARILAKALNCTHLRDDGNPCGECSNCQAFSDGSMLDIIEIDGASNNGVANVRDLIERARFQPTLGKYKIYIIDEVHMLSSGAFNALLKTLEEPPEHVKFILATTELHKIPETIISRAQRYDFRKITESDIVARLRYVAEQESIQADSEAISQIARLARWGLRDALSLFEQYSIGGVLSYEFLRENLSLVGDEFMNALLNAIWQNSLEDVRSQLAELRLRSIEPRRFLEQFLYHLRERAYGAINTEEFSGIWRTFEACSGAYARLKEFPDGFLLLEMTCIGLLGAQSQPKMASIPPDIKKQAPLPKKESKEVPIPEVTISQTSEVIESDSEAQQESKSSPESTQEFSFPALVQHVKDTPKKGVLLTALKSGTFRFESGDAPKFTLISRTEFERSKLDVPETREFLQTSIQTLFWISPEIHFELNSAPVGMGGSVGVAKSSPKNTLNIHDVADIF